MGKINTLFQKYFFMYFECETWLGEKFICRVNLLKGIFLLLYPFPNSLIKYKKLSKKDLIFD